VLDLSKIEAGKMELFIETVDAGALIRDAVEGCRKLAASNRNTVTLDLDERLGTISCDARKLEQALTQILDNATKFTENGSIVVTAAREAAGTGEQIVVAVRDTGIGIARDVLPSLFEKFSVADDSSSSKYGGTGLGLALSQKLCRLMGGDVTVESELGIGSCFTIRLPTVVRAQTRDAEATGADTADTLSAHNLAHAA
jgi:signal transduction histidine kinase